MIFVSAFIMFGKMTLDETKPSLLLDQLWNIVKSTNSQLEFLTLLGIIMNGIMQGYVTSNTVYRFLVENIEHKLYASCGLKKEDGSNHKMYEIHA